MQQQVIVRDQANARPSVHALILQWRDGIPLTARALISERVRLEWEARQSLRETDTGDAPAPLVETFRRPRPKRGLDGSLPATSQAAPSTTLEDVTAVALEGFARNAFFLIVDGRQVVGLDVVIPLRPTSQVTFVRLLPLRGG